MLIKRIGARILEKTKWAGSAKYWERRYRLGGNSGSGSYNQLAIFKAEVLNEFVRENNIETVIEWGCGDGNQLQLAEYPKYIGFDVSESAIKICRKKFKNDKTKKFIWSGSKDFSTMDKAQLALSLDVIYHLIEDDVFEKYMNDLFQCSEKYVIIYSCDFNENTARHCKARRFTDWIEKNCIEEWKLEKFIKNKYPYDENNCDETSWSDFYIYKKIEK